MVLYLFLNRVFVRPITFSAESKESVFLTTRVKASNVIATMIIQENLAVSNSLNSKLNTKKLNLR